MSTAASAFWWAAFPESARWCGVFQGGGAKGVAYVAALRAVEEKCRWFRSVAGSSAGALTASLVAAGFAPHELEDMTANMLAAISPSSIIDRGLHALGPTRALTRYNAAALERLLESHLRDGVRRHGGEPESDVTFAELTTSTGIELYVLALDASTGCPMPFSTETTPTLAVSAAVVASCAIPLAFEPRYVEIDPSARPVLGQISLPLVRRLVDGGAWANFPAFIYTDEAFREVLRLLASMWVDRVVDPAGMQDLRVRA
jgi:predicted acylesterase/phospholipase RssA